MTNKAAGDLRFHILLYTREPNVPLLEELLSSIRNQTETRWSCDICDDRSSAQLQSVIADLVACDDRFRFRTNARRMGPLASTEESLAKTPAGVTYIAFCEQDTVWDPHKLAAARDAFADAGVMMVHSDAASIDAVSGAINASRRRSDALIDGLSAQQLVIENGIVSGSSVIRSSLLAALSPLPRQSGMTIHREHWAAIVASLSGRVVTLQKPLVLFRKHRPRRARSAAEMGIVGAPGLRGWRLAIDLAVRTWQQHEGIVAEAVSDRLPASATGARSRAELAQWLAPKPVHLGLWRRTLALSLAGKPAARVAQRMAVGKLVVNRPRLFSMWRQLAHRLRAARPAPRLAESAPKTAPLAPAPSAVATAPPSPQPTAAAVSAALAVIDRSNSVLPLRFTAQTPRIVILLPSIRAEHVFGGAATAVKLGVHFLQAGLPVRILAIDTEIDDQDRAWLRKYASDHCGASAEDLERLAIACCVNAAAPAHPGDIFVATIWWSACRAATTIEALRLEHGEFYYLIQDYEPGFYAWSDEYALALSTYSMRCIPIVNTQFLADHLEREASLNVPRTSVFMPAVNFNLFKPPSAEAIAGRTKRRIFFYGRPGTPRNLFGVAISALRRFVDANDLDAGAVEVVSAGEEHDPISLGRGVEMRSLGKMSMTTYAETLRDCDVGLSLMLSPHPSYPPFEMAASGLSTVTTDFATKHMGFSDNLIAALPEPDALAEALGRAWRRADDVQGRRDGAQFDLSALGRSLALVAADIAVGLTAKLAKAAPGLEVPACAATAPSSALTGYENWLLNNTLSDRDLALQRQSTRALRLKPMFSVLVPLFRTPLDVFDDMVKSVGAQSYERWQLCLALADTGADCLELKARAEQLAASDERITLRIIKENLGIAGNSNVALEMARGEWCVLLDHDDVLSPEALARLAMALNTYPAADFIYSDKDMIDRRGERRYAPLFKPAWSPDCMLSANYLTHLNAMRTKRLIEIGGWDSATDGAQDWDIFLRSIGASTNVVHVPYVLYHWRYIETSVAAGGFAAKPYAQRGQLRAIEKYLPVAGWPNGAVAYEGPYVRVTWCDAANRPSTSVIVIGKPTAAHQRSLQHGASELISIDADNLAASIDGAVKNARSDVVIVIDANIVPEDDSWVSDLANPLVNAHLALVGGKVLDANNHIADFGHFIQNAVAHPAFFGEHSDYFGPGGGCGWYRNASATSLIAAAFRRDDWLKLGGMAQFSASRRPDVSMSLRLASLGRILLNPFARFRTSKTTTALEPALGSSAQLSAKEAAPFVNGDPYLNRNLDAALSSGAPVVRGWRLDAADPLPETRVQQ